MTTLFDCAVRNIPSYSYWKSDYGRPLVVRSGGADSALLCYLLLANGIAFDYVYIDGRQGASKIAAEKLAIELQDKWFENSKLEEVSSTFERCVNYGMVDAINTVHDNTGNVRSSQAVNWLVGAMRHLDPSRHSCVLFAYILGDQISTMFHEVKKAWEAMVSITLLGCNHIPVEFPLSLYDKSAIIGSYVNELAELYNLTWSCQLVRAWSGNYRPCTSLADAHSGHYCTSCKHREMVENNPYTKLTCPQWDGAAFITNEEPGVMEIVEEV